MKRQRRGSSTQEKFVFGTMKGLLSPQDEQALFEIIERPLPDDVLASFYLGALEPPHE